MTIRKLMFGAGLAFSFVGAAFAGERTRGTSGDAVSGGVTSAAAPVVNEVAPGVAKVTSGGFELTVRANGAVKLSEVVEEYGSVGRYRGEVVLMHGLVTTAPDGARLHANGALGFFKDLLGRNAPVVPRPTSAEENKSVARWTEMAVGSETVLAFANGAVINDGTRFSEPEYARRERTAMSSKNGEELVFANGAVYNH